MSFTGERPDYQTTDAEMLKIAFEFGIGNKFSTILSSQLSVSDDDIGCAPSMTNVTVEVVQDLAPEFNQIQYNGTVEENTPEAYVVTVSVVNFVSAHANVTLTTTKFHNYIQAGRQAAAIYHMMKGHKQMFSSCPRVALWSFPENGNRGTRL